MSNGARYESQAARDAEKQGHGDRKYWDYLDCHAAAASKYYMARGDAEKARFMLTRSLAESLRGNEGD